MEAPLAVTWIVTELLEKLAIHRRLPRATAIDAGSLAARKSLSLIIFIISHRTRSIFGAASVNRRVVGSNPAAPRCARHERGRILPEEP